MSASPEIGGVEASPDIGGGEGSLDIVAGESGSYSSPGGLRSIGSPAIVPGRALLVGSRPQEVSMSAIASAGRLFRMGAITQSTSRQNIRRCHSLEVEIGGPYLT
jgi:hypothetical protein